MGPKPQIFRENWGEILPEKWGFFGANWGLFRAYRRLVGADRDQSLRTPQPQGEEQKLPRKGPFWPQLAPFGPSPRLLSPRLDFPDIQIAILAAEIPCEWRTWFATNFDWDCDSAAI